MKKGILIFLSFLAFSAQGENITGKVVETMDGKEISIPGVSIVLPEINQNAVTDANGSFTIANVTLPQTLIVSFIGYKSDTVLVKSSSPVEIILVKSIDLNEVQIESKRDAVTVSTTKTINGEHITERELLKAACCNLSEAFETNPSVNVAYKDAVTGVKEIQLLGLGGTYVQMLSENIPDMRGLAGIYGLSFVPGPWIESIQLSKGSGSVVNGYESATGQINVEYKKPLDKDLPRYYFNLFADERGGVEGNAIFKKRLNNRWGTLLMLHGRSMKNEVDRNNDGFMDIPDNSTVNIYNRWEYHDNEKLEGQINLKYLSDEIKGGQVEDVLTDPRYVTRVNTQRAEISGKVGILFPKTPQKSIGNIYQVTYHDMTSRFGLKTYNASESSIYVQSIYQNVLGKNNRVYKVGVSYRYNLLEQKFEGLPDRVEESIPGVFLEYTYNYIDRLTLIFGVREDLQANYTFVFTPRFHGKYNFTENLIVRMSAGKSYRNPYLIADHLSVLASSRQIKIMEDILPERAWNYGINFTQRFTIGTREQTFSVDAYRTEFLSQLVLDSYSDSTKIYFYNLRGTSYSNSFQFTFNATILELLTFRVAYKLDDVRSTFNGVLEEQPLVSKNRALGTVSYLTNNEHWKFDYTLVWEGKKKLQNVYLDEGNYGREFSPSFTVMNFQVTKVFRRFELYGGAENMLDYRQTDPIINPENPFGNSFDATNIWGPVAGRRIYAGLRISIR